MAALLLVTGPPGAGKSTNAAVLVERLDSSVLVAGDAFFSFLRRGAVEPWLPEAHRQNHVTIQAAAAASGRYVNGGYTVVYDGVVGPWLLPAFVAAAGLACLHYAVLLPPVERCLNRVATRQDHGFTNESATRRMHRDFSSATIDRRHVLADPAGPPAAVAGSILRAMVQGDLLYTANAGVAHATRPRQESP